MELLNNIVLVLAILVAIIFSLLVLVTGKGDAMSGGGSVRTTFKGKASFDDIISKWTLYMGVAFMSLVLLYTVVNNRTSASASNSGLIQKPAAESTNSAAPEANKPADSANAPAPEANKPAESANAPAPEANKPADSSNVPATDANKPSESSNS